MLIEWVVASRPRLNAVPQASQILLEYLEEKATKSMDSLPALPNSAFFDEWEDQVNPTILPSSTNSDDFEALHLVHEETIAQKNKGREVIQHRRWQLGEIFRSERDYPDGR